MPLMHYASSCAANRQVFNAPIWNYQCSTTTTSCDGVVAWSADDGCLTASAALTTRNIRCTHAGCGCDSLGLKGLTDGTDLMSCLLGAQLGRCIHQHGHRRQNPTDQSTSPRIYHSKTHQQQRSTTKNVRNQHAASVWTTTDTAQNKSSEIDRRRQKNSNITQRWKTCLHPRGMRVTRARAPRSIQCNQQQVSMMIKLDERQTFIGLTTPPALAKLFVI